MELTTQQIQEIDNCLKKKGIKYWDIRIEMLDHVVTDVEKRLDKGEGLEEAISDSFVTLGWDGKLKYLNKKGWQNTNDKYRREHFKGMLNYFKNIKNILLLVVSILALFFLSEILIFKVFKRVCFILFCLPLILTSSLFIKTLFKKYGKSVNLDYGFFYMSFSFMILPGILSLFDNETEFLQKIIWIAVLLIHFLSIYSGYKVYKKSISKVENMRKQLLS
jgi:hypothetical protein